MGPVDPPAGSGNSAEDASPLRGTPEDGETATEEKGCPAWVLSWGIEMAKTETENRYGVGARVAYLTATFFFFAFAVI